MSTPEDRLRQRAAELEAMRAASERREEEERGRQRGEAQQLAREAAEEVEAWRQRLDELITATRKRVPWKVNRNSGEASFHVQVGTASIRLDRRSDGWHVTQVTHELYPSTGLPTNPASIREQVLERMVNIGLEDLYAGRVRPSPDEFGR